MSSAAVGFGAFASGLLGGWYLGWLNGIPGLRKRRTHWAIGIYGGDSPLELGPIPGLRNPVLKAEDVTDVPANFVADPFMIREGHCWYMFFEAFRADRQRGVIALATSEDGMRWTYEQVVLEEPFHLSYPYVFHSDGQHWMVPDTYEPAEIRLYRAAEFPTEWSYVGPLVQGVFADPSLIHFDGKWWLFACSTPQEHDTLRLYHADRLTGRWREHPASPVRRADAHHARPGGRLLERDGRVIRFAQDSRPQYGKQVWAFEVIELSTEAYRERPISDHPVLAPGPESWNRVGMHQLDAHLLGNGSWLATVDGCGEEWTFRPPRRLRLLPPRSLARKLMPRRNRQ